MSLSTFGLAALFDHGHPPGEALVTIVLTWFSAPSFPPAARLRAAAMLNAWHAQQPGERIATQVPDLMRVLRWACAGDSVVLALIAQTKCSLREQEALRQIETDDPGRALALGVITALSGSCPSLALPAEPSSTTLADRNASWSPPARVTQQGHWLVYVQDLGRCQIRYDATAVAAAQEHDYYRNDQIKRADYLRHLYWVTMSDGPYRAAVPVALATGALSSDAHGIYWLRPTEWRLLAAFAESPDAQQTPFGL